MKISMWIPTTKSPIWIQNFIFNEMSQAGNIKSKDTRESVAESLYIAERFAKPGLCLYVEGKDNVDQKLYDGKEFKYYCGHDFIYPEQPTEFK